MSIKGLSLPHPHLDPQVPELGSKTVGHTPQVILYCWGKRDNDDHDHQSRQCKRGDMPAARLNAIELAYAFRIDQPVSHFQSYEKRARHSFAAFVEEVYQVRIR